MKEIKLRTKVLNACLFPSKIEEVRINCICCSWRKTNVDTEMQTIPLKSVRLGFEAKILLNFAGMLACFCCNWRRTNVDTKMQTIPPESMRLSFERCCWTFLALKEGNQETNLGLNAWLFPSRIGEVEINCNCCSWRRTNVDTEVQTIPPELLRLLYYFV